MRRLSPSNLAHCAPFPKLRGLLQGRGACRPGSAHGSHTQVACAGFRVLEAGAGTGGLTKDALPLFDQDLHHEMLRYCATDVTNAFSGGLLDAVKSPKLIFKARCRG